MGKVTVDIAMSLDGFICGPNGEDAGLHDYFFEPSPASAEVLEEGFKETGVILMGRAAYEVGAKFDGFADSPYNVPNFVLTHNAPEKKAKGAENFVFVTDGIESLLRQAQAAAGDRDVVIGGGANITQQFLKAGLVDEVQIHLVPVILGGGIRLFDHLADANVKLENTRAVVSPK